MLKICTNFDPKFDDFSTHGDSTPTWSQGWLRSKGFEIMPWENRGGPQTIPWKPEGLKSFRGSTEWFQTFQLSSAIWGLKSFREGLESYREMIVRVWNDTVGCSF